MLFISVLVLSFIAIGVEGDSQCDYEVHEQCGLLTVYEQIKNIQGLPSEDFLRNNCKVTQEALLCHAVNVTRCHGMANSMFHDAHFEGLLALVSALCDHEASLRTDYLLHFGCYNSLVGDFGDCLIGLNGLLNLFKGWETNNKRTAHETQQDVEMEMFCLQYQIIPNCYVRKVDDACGMEEANIFSRLLRLYYEPFVKVLCNKENNQIYLDRLLAYMVNNADEIQSLKNYFG